MSLFNLKARSFRFILNHFLGSFLASPLEPQQLEFFDDKVVCSDLYLNIKKLNAMLAEQNIPFVICVAYIGQIVVHFPLKVEVIRLELVVQTTSYDFSRHSDEMLNSLVSSVTAFAFAAVSVADDAGGIQVNDSSLQSDAVDSKMMEKIVEKLDKFVHNVGSKACEMPSLVDKEAIERAARFIDSLLLGATATFRDLHLRLQCPLTLSGIHRACDLRLRIHLLEVNNVESESTAPSDVSSTSAASGGDGENRRGGATSHHRQRSCSKATPDAKSGTDGAAGGSSSLWSWLWANMWRLGLDSTTSRTSGNRGDGGSQSEASVPPVMRKLIRLEDVTLHWDLWDTSMGGTGQHSPASSRSNSPTCSPTVTAPSRDVYSGPTPESMIASACLLRLPTSHNYCNICLRDPSILSQILSSESTSPSARPTLVDLSIDLGPVVACICPSAVFWLTLTVTQLTTLYNTYLAGRYNDRSLDKPEDDLHKSNFGLIDSGQPFSLNRRNSVDVLTTNLVDLDLSSSPRTDLLASSGLQSMTESNMFRSCLGGSAYQGAGITVDCLSDASKLPPFTLSARCRLFVLTLFHADEEASPFTGDLSSQPLLSCGSDIETSSSGSSSSSDDQFHEVSSRQNSLTLQAPPPGSLVGINDFFAGLDGVQCLEYNDQQWVCASEWIAQVNTDLALLASPRDHLRLAAGFCQLDVTCELADDGDSTTHQRVTGQITSLLLTECLFSHAAADSLSVTKLLTFSESDNLLVPAIRVNFTTSSSSHTNTFPIDPEAQSGVLGVRLSSCTIDIDPSLVDRLHRLVDAVTTAERASANIVLAAADLYSFDHRLDNDDARVRKWLGVGNRGGHYSPVASSIDDDVDFSNSALRLPPVTVSCPCLRVRLRVPIPLETVPPFPNEDLASMRARLYSRQSMESTIANASELPVWWKPCLRPETLVFVLRDLSFATINAVDCSSHLAARLIPGDVGFEVTFRQLEGHLVGPECGKSPILQIVDRSASGLTSLFFRMAPAGRQHLTEPQVDAAIDSSPRRHRKVTIRTPSPPPLSPDTVSSTMSQQNTAHCHQDTNRHNSSGSSDDIGEVLLRKFTPKAANRSPFIRKTAFLEDNPQNVWDKDYLSPGDAEHLAMYSANASQHSRFFLDVSLPVAVVNLPNNHTVALIYSRVLRDLVLWRSLLPSDKVTRATLEPGGQVITLPASDHRYWFFLEPVPLTKIYAHPLAAQAAEERHHVTPGASFSHSDSSNFNTTLSSVDEDDQAGGGDGKSSNDLYKPSLLFASVSITTAEVRVRIPPNRGAKKPRPSSLRSSSPQVVFTARSVALTTEVCPRGQSELFYASLTSRQIECHVSDVLGSSRQFGGEDATHGKISVPLFLPFPSSTNEPMFSLAVEKRSVNRIGPHEPLAPNFSEDVSFALRLRRACLCYWPRLDTWGADADWLHRLLSTLRLPSEDLAAVYPAFVPPVYSVKVHAQFNDLALTWPPVSAFRVDSTNIGGGGGVGAGLADIRPLVFVESVTSFFNLDPGVNFIGFLHKIGLWLVPPQSSASTLKSKKRHSASATGENHVRFAPIIASEVNALNACVLSEGLDSLLSRSVKIVDLDHLEVRLFSEPLSCALDEPEAESVAPEAERLDIRLTNNMLRVTTCVDSLVAMRLVLAGLGEASASPNAPSDASSSSSAQHATSSRKSSSLLTRSSDNEIIAPPEDRSPHWNGTAVGRSRLEDLISDAMADVDVPPSTPEPSTPPTDDDYDFVVISGSAWRRKKPLTDPDQAPRQLYDGTLVVASTPLRPTEGFYGDGAGDAPSSHKGHPSATGSTTLPSRRLSLFTDPPGAETLFALTLYDVSFSWTVFGGLDFPALNSDAEVEGVLFGSEVRSRESRPARSSPPPEPLGLGVQEIPELSRSPVLIRLSDQAVTLRLSSIYFRKSLVVYRSHPRPRAFCHGSVSASSPSSDALHRHNQVPCRPTTRYSLRIKDVKIVDGIVTSKVNHLLHVQRPRRPQDDAMSTQAIRASVAMWPSAPSINVATGNLLAPADLEAEAKFSIQPIQINLDQVMFIFLRNYHNALTLLMGRYLHDLEAHASIFDIHQTVKAGQEATPREHLNSPPTQTVGVEEVENDEPVFIKKLTISPNLSIRFNYYGRQLDRSQGTLVGLLALFLQLKNAELVLPKWVYRRGYRGVSCLLEEVFDHWMSTLQSQLPQILMTSVGPMHEVANIVHGLWDFVRLSIDGFRHNSLSNGANLTADSFVCVRCRKAVVGGGGRCPCGRLAVLPRLLTRNRPDYIVYGLRTGAHSLSTNALWSLLELSSQGVRTAQILFETAFDILTPGPSIRQRQGRLHQPADLREGLSNAVYAVRRGVHHLTYDLQMPVVADPQKGSVGAIGDVLRQIPPSSVTPFVIGCEATANILGGLRNQLRPEAKREDEEKWKCTQGL